MSNTTVENDQQCDTMVQMQLQQPQQQQLHQHQQIPAGLRGHRDDRESETTSSRKDTSATATTTSATTIPNRSKVDDHVPSNKDSPIPIVNEFSDQSHKSKNKPKREKKTLGRKHMRRPCDSFMDVTGFSNSMNIDSLFSENATAFALHQSANNMHLVNVSLKNQIVTLKNQVNRLSFDNQRISRQNRMLMLENERLITTIQNSSLLMQSTVSSILPKREDQYELAPIKRKTSCGSKNESDLERSTRCTIKEFDNLLSTLQTKEDSRKFRELDLYFDEEHDTRKTRLKSVSQYDVIVKWLNNDEQSDDRNSKKGDDSDSKDHDSRDGDEEESSHDSSQKQSSCEEVTSKILDNDFIKENLGSIKTIVSSTITETATPIAARTPVNEPTPVVLPASSEVAQFDTKPMITPVQRTSSVISPLLSSSAQPPKTPSSTSTIEAPNTKEELEIGKTISSKRSDKSLGSSNGDVANNNNNDDDHPLIDLSASTPAPKTPPPQNAEKDADEKITLENLIFGDMAVWMELDNKPAEAEKTEFLQNWLDDLKDKTRKFAESCKSSPLQIEPDKKPPKNDEMEHVEFIHLCNEMIKRMDSLITKDSDKLSRRPSKSNAIMNFLMNENNSLNLKYSPKKETSSNGDTRSISAPKDQSVHHQARDLIGNSPIDSIEPPTTSFADLDDEKADGWKSFHKCLKDLEEVNVRRTNDAIRQTMVVRALRKLLAKQCGKIPKQNTTSHPTPGPSFEMLCSSKGANDDGGDVTPVRQKPPTPLKSSSGHRTVDQTSPKPTSEISSKDQTPREPETETKFSQVFSNASKSIFLSNVNFVPDQTTPPTVLNPSLRDDYLSWIPVMRVNKLQRDLLHHKGCVVNSIAAGDTTSQARKSRHSRIRRRKCSPNVTKISAALRRLQEEEKGIPMTWLCIGLVFTLMHVKIWRSFAYVAPVLNSLHTSFNFLTK